MTEGLSIRRQQAEERREQILDAAVQAFSERGFAGASIREIARTVGVTEGLLYHYFESKDQLLQACWKERSWRAHLERILAQAEGKSVTDVLREVVTEFLGTLKRNSALVRMCAEESRRNPDLAAEHLQHIQENHRLLTGFLQARIEAGEIRAGADIHMASGLLMGCAYSCFLLWGDTPTEQWDEIVGTLAQNGVDVVIHGISPEGT